MTVVLLRRLPWLLFGAVFVVALLLNDVGPAAVALYSAYFAIGVVLPGTLVYRAFRGSFDVGLGAATGLLVQIVGWALAAATGLQQLLWCWPLLVIGAFVAVPSLRRNWRRPPGPGLPLRWHWAMSAVLLLTVGWAASSWVLIPVPPADASYYPDLMYHLALVHEMTRSMPFEVPQLAGDTLRYHYLSDADMAAASMITGLPAELVLTRLWMVPIAATAALVVAALAREVSGRWWAGPLAAAVALIGAPLTLGGELVPYGNSPLVFASPSQTYAIPLLGLLTLIAVDLLRGGRLGPVWFLVPVLALACAGAKSSALPPLVAGVALCFLVKRRSWAVFGFLVALLIPMYVGTRLFAGGGAGTLGVQPLSVLRWMPPYAETLGVNDGVSAGGLLPPGLQGASGPAWAFVAGIIVWWLLMESPRWLGVFHVSARQDPAYWLLSGMILAGLGAMWLLWHPSASQLYFFLCALPAGAIVTTWLLADQVRRWWIPVVGLVAGAAWSVLAPNVFTPAARNSWHDWSWTMATPVLRALLAVGAGLVLVLVVVLRKRVRPSTVAVAAAPASASLAGPGSASLAASGSASLAGPGSAPLAAPRSAPLGAPRSARPASLPASLPAALLASSLAALLSALLGASVAGGVETQARTLWAAAFNDPAPLPITRTVFREEMSAALWVNANTPTNDVIATNVHCMPMNRYKPCDARAFWVSGLTGRRVLVESWAYSDATVAANGKDGLKYVLQPAPDPIAFDLNQRIFTAPTPTDLNTLRTQYGVKWLIADLRAGKISPALATLTKLRRTEGPITIYEL
ncbi:hypothetical protein [Symbioplanes lichenis]|uniref:hypothetical protein n=1 Tax=Symbioplanes lichenis TaxID=1629072 RepID=UPI00273A1928|nr:hypothetical protein [Actinoplanes lichenis]